MGKITKKVPKNPQKVAEKALREGAKMAAEYWQREFAPLHFRAGASARYNYKKRTPKYLSSKKRKVGHTIPLVLTGELRRRVTGRFETPKVRQNSGDKSLKVKLNFGNITRSPQVANEVAHMIPEEIEELTGIIISTLDNSIDQSIVTTTETR